MEISTIKNHTVAILYTNYDIQTSVWNLNVNSFLQENIFKVSVCLKMTILKHQEREKGFMIKFSVNIQEQKLCKKKYISMTKVLKDYLNLKII